MAATYVVAADIRPHIGGTGSFRIIVIEGDISPGDFDTFLRIAKENQGRISGVYLFTTGGDFYEAMKIGRALRALELSSQVPMRDSKGHPSCEDELGLGIYPTPKNPTNCTCASAGFFIHIGAIHRGGTYLAVHRPYFVKGKFGELSQNDAQKTFEKLQDSARSYMHEMGVPKHIQEDVLGTPSERALVLDDKSVKTYFWLELPYRHEWKKNRCTKLSEPERQRLRSLSLRLLRAKSSSDSDLSKAEWSDLHSLREMEDEEKRCDIAIEAKSRIEAYERYFGIKPNDYSGHNFDKWGSATKYLGRQFYELLSEERFEEGKLAGSSFLERNATANAPAYSLSDSRFKPKVVAWISLVSAPNPSPEFTQRLVQSLEGTWGKRSSGNGITDWHWERSDFSAKLSYQPVSAQGSYLSLLIDSK